MAQTDDVPRISLQVSRGVVVASVQTDLEEGVLARFRQDVLERIHATDARGLVIDLSGLETLDAEEFEGLRRVISMARVMGTETVLVGLSAGIVSALVTTGADVDGLRATLDIDEALAMLDPPQSEGAPGAAASDASEHASADDAAAEAEA